MKKFYRSKNRVLGGICGGLGDYLNIDSNIFRVLLVAAWVVSDGFILIPIFYVILWLTIPKKKF